MPDFPLSHLRLCHFFCRRRGDRQDPRAVSVDNTTAIAEASDFTGNTAITITSANAGASIFGLGIGTDAGVDVGVQ